MYALIISESPGVITGQEARHVVRARLDLALAEPFDHKQALEYRRAHWGTDAEAIAAAAQKDAMFGDSSYG